MGVGVLFVIISNKVCLVEEMLIYLSSLNIKSYSIKNIQTKSLFGYLRKLPILPYFAYL